MKKKDANRYDSVWDALADTPEQAANLRARTELMQKIAAIVRENGWTQVEAARRCGVTQPRMNDLLRGRVSRFSLDALGEPRDRDRSQGSLRARGCVTAARWAWQRMIEVDRANEPDSIHGPSPLATRSATPGTRPTHAGRRSTPGRRRLSRRGLRTRCSNPRRDAGRRARRCCGGPTTRSSSLASTAAPRRHD